MTMPVFLPNTPATYLDVNCKVAATTNTGLLLEFPDRDAKFLPLRTLSDAIINGDFKLQTIEQVDTLNTALSPELEQKYHWVSLVVTYMNGFNQPTAKNVLNQAKQNAFEQLGTLNGKIPSNSSLKRWFSRWINNGKSVSYVISKTKEDRRKHFSDVCYKLADEVISDEYLQLNGANKRQTHGVFLDKFKSLVQELEEENSRDNNLSGEVITLGRPMSYQTFANYIDRLDAYEVDKARLGLQAARNIHKTVTSSVITTRPLERVEIDAVHLNILIENEYDAKSPLKPVIHMAIDCETRLIVAYYIEYYTTKQGESAAAVGKLLEGICNPAKVSKHLNIPFPLGGKPESIVCDSGSAYISSAIKIMLNENGIVHVVNPKASPFLKGKIERFFLTLRQQCMTKLPSYIDSKKNNTGIDLTFQKHLMMDKVDFETHLESFIFNIYHNNPHQGLDRFSPNEYFNNNKGRFPPPILVDFTNLRSLFGSRINRTINTKTGMQINKIKYNCTELSKLGHNLNRRFKNKSEARKVEVIYNELDINKITVLDHLNNVRIIVPAISHKLPDDTTLSEFNASRSVARQGNGTSHVMPTLDKKSNYKKPKSSNSTGKPQSALDLHESENFAEKLFEKSLGDGDEFLGGHSQLEGSIIDTQDVSDTFSFSSTR